MAKASVERKFSLTITLDQDELTYLCTVLQNTGGSPTHSLRRHSDRIIFALKDAGINIYEFEKTEEIERRRGSSGSIYFVDRD